MWQERKNNRFLVKKKIRNHTITVINALLTPTKLSKFQKSNRNNCSKLNNEKYTVSQKKKYTKIKNFIKFM